MGWIQPWAIWDEDSQTYVMKDDRVGSPAPAWTFPSYSGTVLLGSTGGSAFAPVRDSNAYSYGVLIDSDLFFVGGANTKSYMLGIFGDRPAGSAATGDSNDALIRASTNNYAANDTNFILRGINVSVNNRSGGTLGRMDNALGVQNKSGGTVNNIVGLTVVSENYGTVSDMFGGIDILLKNEAAVATLEYGLRIRNENNSIAGPVTSAILVTDSGANTGWTYGLNLGDSSAVTVATVLYGAPTRGSNDYEYGFLLDSDVFFTGGAAQKSYMVGIFGDRPLGSAATGDSNDALLRISGNNYAANDTNFIFRGLNASINNRSGGTLGRIEHSLGTQGKSGGTVNNILGLTITAENYGTVSDVFGGLDVLLKNEAAVATLEFGIRIRNENNSIADAIGAAILVSDTGANTGWDYILDFNGASVVVADIRLNAGMVIHQDKADRVMIGALVGICNDNAPADNAPAGGVVLYFDGTDLKAINSAGATATLNNAAFS